MKRSGAWILAAPALLASAIGRGTMRGPLLGSSVPKGTKFVEANGLGFGYFERGEGPLVLLLHGFPDRAHTFDED